ncbi:peptidylprolyl isomerase [Rhodospirillum rubrum F11]|nr:peptidylprolyl isomerase [Rhodospirillum rubrum F11]QXG82171.1 peptidylprolyl isomerase [Rhodospirillum rubrum]
MRRILISLFALLACMGTVMTDTKAADPENTLYMDLKDGRVVIELRPDLAPKHVERIKLLVRKGFYDGTPFHRVIDGFMVQGGDPTGTGRGGSDLPDLPAEFSPPSKARHLRGVTSMARTADPDSANSQFFIMLAPSSHLDGQYTIWGQVTKGMDFVDMIKKGDSRANGSVSDPDRIVKVQVAADVK